MNNSIFNTIRRAAVTTILGLSALAAQAGIVKYNFTVHSNFGPAAGETFQGSFSFNAPAIPASGDAQFNLSAFEFTFNGSTFGIDSLLSGSAVFSDGVFLGLDANSPKAHFSFVPEDAFTPASFEYTIGGRGGVGDFTATLATSDPSGTVPEPETAALMLAGLGLLGWAQRRRNSQGATLAAA